MADTGEPSNFDLYSFNSSPVGNADISFVCARHACGLHAAQRHGTRCRCRRVQSKQPPDDRRIVVARGRSSCRGWRVAADAGTAAVGRVQYHQMWQGRTRGLLQEDDVIALEGLEDVMV